MVRNRLSRTAGWVLGFALLVTPAHAATLDVAADGDDLVFTWDSGADDLLRGTTPDALAPWMTNVSPPLRVAGENLVRGEDAFYRLASGSNLASRIERTYVVADGVRPDAEPTTFPIRRTIVTKEDLFTAYPTLVEAVWADYPEGASRVEGMVVGTSLPVPPHGALLLAFDRTTTITIVGSHDDADAGVPAREVQEYRQIPGLLPVPPGSRWDSALELLCGERGVDWLDVDGNGRPDTCGRDTDADGRYDTGLWGGPVDSDDEDCIVGLWLDGPLLILQTRRPFGYQWVGSMVNYDFAVDAGRAVFVEASRPTCVTSPFRIPTW